jgi:hypothetical protein
LWISKCAPGRSASPTVSRTSRAREQGSLPGRSCS